MADEDTTTQQANGSDSAAQPGEKWGDAISEVRQAELRELFERQKAWAAQPEATRGDSVFKDVQLTGADVYWLAGVSGHVTFGKVPNLHLEGAVLSGAQLEGADLALAQLEGAYLRGAQLEGAYLSEAQLKGADLALAQLKGADLALAQLKGANLREAQLEGANLREARLNGANLRGTQLQGANLFGTQLQGADITSATLDKTSHLNRAVLTGASLDQVTYDGVNLTVVDWGRVPVLGDELTARQRKNKYGMLKEREQRLDEYAAAVRANRVLAVTLRSQGMNEDADRYAYRAQLMQRTVLRLRRRWGPAFGSWLLDLISGYGYQPIRSVFTYALVILTFAAAYFALTNFAITPFLPSHSSPLAWYEAIVLSVSSFHGRGLFPTGLSLGDPIAILAAVEAIIGLLIEITFIATFTQRFFAR